MSLPTEPWVAPAADEAGGLEREASVEVGPGHELSGRTLTAIARCSDCDHVVFRLDDDTWAVVHLTWSHKAEPAPLADHTPLPQPRRGRDGPRGSPALTPPPASRSGG